VTVNFDELDSAAGGCYVELFSGGECTRHGYGLAVSTYPGGTPVAYKAINAGVDHKWVRFYLNPSHPESIVRGKKLKFTFSRVDPDSLQFYYDTTAGYSQYGQMIAPPGQSPIPATAGLAMRVCARLNPIDSTTWGATCFLPDSHSDWGKWADSMNVSGATWGTFYVSWDTIESDTLHPDFTKMDNHVRYIVDSAHLEPLAVLVGTPKWASSRIDTFVVNGESIIDTTVFAPPLYMNRGPDSNLWVRWLDTLLEHQDSGFRPADKVHNWSIWNEPNEGCDRWHKPDSYPGWTGWWRSPSFYYAVDTTWGESGAPSTYSSVRWRLGRFGHALGMRTTES
jgi:hypothetical protein